VASWRDKLLSEFTPGIARLTLVADPDGLLTEEGMSQGIRERGFEVIQFEDHVVFRYDYESRYRSRWDRGEETDLVVVLRSPSHDLDTLPYDLLQAGRRLSFNLGDLFPNLSYPVVAALDRADLDALFDAQQTHAPGQLGDNATKDFILHHVFEIVPDLIKEPHDLLRVLLRRHYRGRRIPTVLDERLVALLRRNKAFEDWPLDEIVPEREAFFAFLQERWPAFLDSLSSSGGEIVRERPAGYGAGGSGRAGGGAGEGARGARRGGVPPDRRGYRFSGPALIPFGHDDVRVYVDNLFLEGLLRPVEHPRADSLADTWAVCGVRVSPEENRRRRIEGLLGAIETAVPTRESRYREWLDFAPLWAELTALMLEEPGALPKDDRARFEALRERVDSAIADWALKRYTDTMNCPPDPPVLVHYIPRYLARTVADDRSAKIALVVVDGLSADQWVVLREVLREGWPGIIFSDHYVFAWIPTVTSVSRQAIFAGKAPFCFPDTIERTDREPHLWAQFWADQGLAQREVAYGKVVGDSVGSTRGAAAADGESAPGEPAADDAAPEGPVADLDKVRELLERPKLRVLGLVVEKVDRIMHGMQLGSAGMHNQIRQWAGQGFMTELVGLLHGAGFRVFVTSDHGNVEARGIGNPSEGVIAEKRGQRVRIYEDQALRARVKSAYPECVEWPAIGLPQNYLALLAPGRAAFVREGERVVSHGGISAEELLVPFVEIRRREE